MEKIIIYTLYHLAPFIHSLQSGQQVELHALTFLIVAYTFIEQPVRSGYDAYLSMPLGGVVISVNLASI